MVKVVKGKHFIRQWRERRGLSLRKLAERLEIEPGGELLASHAAIQRVETGEVGYHEELLNALAEALDVTVSDLLNVDPTKDGEVIDLMRRMTDAQRNDAITYMRFLLSRPA